MSLFNNPHPHGGFPRPGPQTQPGQQNMQTMPQAQFDPRMMPQQGFNPQYPQGYNPQMMPPQGYDPRYPQYPQQYPPQMMPQQFSQQMMPQQQMPQNYPTQQMPQQMFVNPNPPAFGMPEANNSARFGGRQAVPPMNSMPVQQMQPQPQPQAPVQPQAAPAPAPQPRLEDVQKVMMVSTSLVVGTRTTPFTVDDFLVDPDQLKIIDCVEEAKEAAIEYYYLEKTEKVVKCDCVVVDMRHGCTSALFIENLDTKPGRLASVLKTYMKGVSTKNDMMFALTLNEQLTCLVNDILYINTGGEIKIDSFMDDYGDLMEALEGPSTFVANEVVMKLASYMQDLKEAYNSYTKSSDDEVESSALLDKFSVFYVDALNMELNLHLLKPGQIVALNKVEQPTKQQTNALYSLVDCIYTPPIGISSVKNLIMTYEKELFEVYVNLNGKYYIKRYN